MKTLPQIFENNRNWSAQQSREDPAYFKNLANQQAPRYLWIGCSDSRVPANQICGLKPGEIFVHRNIANMMVHTDMNCLSVLQYAVEALKVTDIIVCGHYGCGGVKAAMRREPLGLIDNWLRHIKDVFHNAREELHDLEGDAQFRRLCELNVAQQVANVVYTTTVQDAWARGADLSVHGWIYGLEDGLLNDLDLCVSKTSQLPPLFNMDNDMI